MPLLQSGINQIREELEDATFISTMIHIITNTLNFREIKCEN
jgi:hypothetical protein